MTKFEEFRLKRDRSRLLVLEAAYYRKHPERRERLNELLRGAEDEEAGLEARAGGGPNDDRPAALTRVQARTAAWTKPTGFPLFDPDLS